MTLITILISVPRKPPWIRKTSRSHSRTKLVEFSWRFRRRRRSKKGRYGRGGWCSGGYCGSGRRSKYFDNRPIDIHMLLPRQCRSPGKPYPYLTQASGVLARTNTNSSVLKSNQTERMKRSHRSRIDVKFSSEKYTPNRDRPLSSHTSQ